MPAQGSYALAREIHDAKVEPPLRTAVGFLQMM